MKKKLNATLVLCVVIIAILCFLFLITFYHEQTDIVEQKVDYSFTTMTKTITFLPEKNQENYYFTNWGITLFLVVPNSDTNSKPVFGGNLQIKEIDSRIYQLTPNDKNSTLQVWFSTNETNNSTIVFAVPIEDFDLIPQNEKDQIYAKMKSTLDWPKDSFTIKRSEELMQEFADSLKPVEAQVKNKNIKISFSEDKRITGFQILNAIEKVNQLAIQPITKKAIVKLNFPVTKITLSSAVQNFSFYAIASDEIISSNFVISSMADNNYYLNIPIQLKNGETFSQNLLPFFENKQILPGTYLAYFVLGSGEIISNKVQIEIIGERNIQNLAVEENNVEQISIFLDNNFENNSLRLPIGIGDLNSGKVEIVNIAQPDNFNVYASLFDVCLPNNGFLKYRENSLVGKEEREMLDYFKSLKIESTGDLYNIECSWLSEMFGEQIVEYYISEGGFENIPAILDLNVELKSNDNSNIEMPQYASIELKSLFGIKKIIILKISYNIELNSLISIPKPRFSFDNLSSTLENGETPLNSIKVSAYSRPDPNNSPVEYFWYFNGVEISRESGTIIDLNEGSNEIKLLVRNAFGFSNSTAQYIETKKSTVGDYLIYKKFKRLGDTFGGFIIEKINGGSIFILNEDYNTKTISFKVNSNLGNLIRWFDNGKELFDFNGIFQPSIKFDKGDHIVQAVITSSNEESKISDPIRIVIYGSSTQRQKMQLLFVPVNWDNNESFEQAANITKDLFLGTLSCGNDIPVKIFEDSELNCKFDPDQPGADQKVILCLQNNGYSIKAEDKVIGLMPKSAYSLKATYLGNGGQYPINSIILYFDIKEKYPTMRDGIVALHEMGHVYGLCDEYSLSAWFAQKVGSKSTGFLDGCPLNNYPKICGVTDKIGELNRSWRDIKSPIKGETPDYLKNDYLYFEPSDLLLPPWNPICNQNGICEEDDKNLGRFTSENYLNCPSDCNEINPSDDCGNNFCVFPETKSNCPQDCDQKDCVGEITDEGDLVWFSIMGDIGNDNYSFETENGTKTYLARYPNKFQVLFDGLICGSQ